MFFSKNLIIGESVKNKKIKVFFLKKGKSFFKIYLICIFKNSKNILEIIKSNEINKDFYLKKRQECYVIGVSQNKLETFEIVKNIIILFVKEKRDFRELKNFIFEKYF